eukprot:CAMPEP_0204094738 /NCGR_PEP_ID=MMETSP0360-20130528/191081_1 /ASSEMBLY_ACC=CAM_ASM_000342 /TAXON_ID=268821 /ORGANISM="Scrippsiella Hangoei, Strain SHTV-5" /LENGTH=242 /DNA_ID=CAMNT_0051044055 /DNA_START=215 /DNA_END=941 /DNA_ORIENTATION=+
MPHSKEELTPVQAIVEQAGSCWVRRSYEECARLARQVLDIDPCNIDMACLLSRLLAEGLGVERDSCICLEGLLSSGRQTLPCGHELHQICVLEMRRFGASGQCPLCRTASEDLTPVQAIVERAGACWIRNSHEECARLARQVLDIDPCNIDMACMLSFLLFEGWGIEKDVDSAFKLLAMPGAATHAQVLVITGTFHFRQHDLAQAERFFVEGRRLGDPVASGHLGMLYSQQGRYAEAEEVFR